jgi:REP element-mobilizing transposase RayT
MRKLRYAPEGGATFEVTCRTLQARLLLRPSAELNQIVPGILGRAQRLYGVQLFAYVFVSNHFHLLLRVGNTRQLSRFMGYLNANLAKEVSRLTGWSGKVWERRYQAILVSDEEGALIGRFRYIVSHGVKEDLVPRLQEWPGIHCVHSLLGGEPLAGHWFDRTLEYAMRRRGETFDRFQFATPETVHLSSLPCWAHLSPEAYRQRVAAMVTEIEEEAAAARQRAGKHSLGARAILAQHPHTRPEKCKKSPAPFVHAVSREMKKLLWEGYVWFVAEFRNAAEKLRVGNPGARFPAGSFPPALPYVGR